MSTSTDASTTTPRRMTEDLFKSVHAHPGSVAHYNTFEIVGNAMVALRLLFPNGRADEMNFVLFSTGGVHGSYATLEQIEASFEKDGPPAGMTPADELPQVTVLVVQPRLVCLRFGNAIVTPENLPWLKGLRASSMAAVAGIGGSPAPNCVDEQQHLDAIGACNETIRMKTEECADLRAEVAELRARVEAYLRPIKDRNDHGQQVEKENQLLALLAALRAPVPQEDACRRCAPLCAEVAELRVQLSLLRVENAALRAENAELRAKVEQHQRESFANASLASERLGELTLTQESLNEAENENLDLRERVALADRWVAAFRAYEEDPGGDAAFLELLAAERAYRASAPREEKS